jgi:hypothetical protein
VFFYPGRVVVKSFIFSQKNPCKSAQSVISAFYFSPTLISTLPVIHCLYALLHRPSIAQYCLGDVIAREHNICFRRESDSPNMRLPRQQIILRTTPLPLGAIFPNARRNCSRPVKFSPKLAPDKSFRCDDNVPAATF